LQVKNASTDMTLNERAALTERYAAATICLQNVAVLLLGPLVILHSVRQERAQRTIELLLTSPLSEREILWGKTLAHAALLASTLATTLPVLILINFWGAVDLRFLALNLANTLLNVVSVCGLCTYASLVESGASVLWPVFNLVVFPANALGWRNSALLLQVP